MPFSPSSDHRSTTCRRAVGIAFVLLAAQATPAWAAKIYRCGNAFQDQPCPEPKAAEQRPAERPAVSRDASPCSGPAKEANGRECLAKTSTRDPQTVTLVEAKR